MDAAIAGGRTLIDDGGDGIVLAGGSSEPLIGPHAPIPTDPTGLAFTILQGCRLRLTRAEFIACPSCGRTQFDLQATTRRIQERTAHLSGVKIAIMGCIVNGPGEMADADFGYVGSAPGRVDLYVGKTRVKQTVPEGEAPQRLVDLIKEHGMWVDLPGPRE
jgi:(E)-4-hydroxy-3-methylbut-2-enyl-diphosphate synthase